MALSSDGISEVLKFILLGVILLCIVGVVMWYISDKFPLYAAKKEVQIALKDYCTAYSKWSKTADETVTIDYINQKEWVILDKETKSHWQFQLIGDPAIMVQAQSLPSMPAGRDHCVYADIETGKEWGWGIPATDDSISSGLVKEDAYSKPAKQ